VLRHAAIKKRWYSAVVKLARAAFLGAIGKLDAISEMWEKVSKNTQVKVVDCIWPLTPTFSRTPHASPVWDATDPTSDIAKSRGISNEIFKILRQLQLDLQISKYNTG